MKYTTLILLFLFSIHCYAKPAGAGFGNGAGPAWCGTFMTNPVTGAPLPPFGAHCTPDWGGHSDSGLIVDDSSNSAITHPNAPLMASTHINLFIWDVHDEGFTHAQSTMCMRPGSATWNPANPCPGTYAGGVAKPRGNGNVSSNYWITNPYGNGSTVTTTGWWTVGWLDPLFFGYLGIYSYPITSITGPITIIGP